MSPTAEKPGPELGESSQGWVLRSQTTRQGTRDQSQFGMKQSLKMGRKMPRVCPQCRIGQKPGPFIRLSRHLLSAHYVLGTGCVPQSSQTHEKSWGSQRPPFTSCSVVCIFKKIISCVLEITCKAKIIVLSLRN